MTNVMSLVLIYDLSLVNDDAVFGDVVERIMVLVQPSESVLVLVGVGMLLCGGGGRGQFSRRERRG
jgi:hypothetical protein